MKGKKEKKDYDQNIGLHEVFLESVPTALIITVIWLKADGKKENSNDICRGLMSHTLEQVEIGLCYRYK